MSKNQFTGTATQPQRNRKFCQFNKDQYCTYIKPGNNYNQPVENIAKDSRRGLVETVHCLS